MTDETPIQIPSPLPMSVRDAGKLGGNKVKATYGREFYQAIGRKGGEATKKNNGSEFYERIGKMGGTKGGDATMARHGTEHYQAIGKKGGAKVRSLIAAGKAALEGKP